MTHASDIEAQAAEWLAQRDSVGEAGDNAQFAAWLAADARHRAAYLRLAAAWERTARLKLLRPEGGRIDPDLLERPRSRWTRWRVPLVLAAGIAALAVLAAGWLGLDSRVLRYRTDVGGLARVVLRDGSIVTLNTDTELRVRLTPARREVELVRGEARFVVAHDTARPFEVSAGGRIVRAVGTAFDVRLDPGKELEVMVTEGRIALLDAPVPGQENLEPAATISAGESALVETHGVVRKVTVSRVSATAASRRLAWEAGNLSFQGETLAEAVAEFNRYNRRKLKVEDPAIANLQIGGDFQALDVDSFVEALQHSFGVACRAADDGTLILERTARPAQN
jgi:transmembrane sensor